jgi:hypothetical protein
MPGDEHRHETGRRVDRDHAAVGSRDLARGDEIAVGVEDQIVDAVELCALARVGSDELDHAAERIEDHRIGVNERRKHEREQRGGCEPLPPSSSRHELLGASSAPGSP